MKIGSIEKWVGIIEHLSQNSRGLNLSELSSLTGMPKSTVHHILGTLLPHDYIYQDSKTKKYYLGSKFLSISHRMIENFDLRKIASEHMHRLQQRCKGGNINLFILRNRNVVCIEKLEALEGLGLSYGIGYTVNPHITAGGKVLLSELSPEQLKAIYPNKKLPSPALAKNTIANRDTLLKELANVRIQGYAIDNEESHEGVRCVAAPIRAGGEIVASLSISGLAAYITMERIDLELKRPVIETAKEISKEMMR